MEERDLASAQCSQAIEQANNIKSHLDSEVSVLQSSMSGLVNIPEAWLSRYLSTVAAAAAAAAAATAGHCLLCISQTNLPVKCPLSTIKRCCTVISFAETDGTHFVILALMSAFRNGLFVLKKVKT